MGAEAKKDLHIRQLFLADYNGRSMLIDENFLNGDFLKLYTDAAGSSGYGAIFGTHWFLGKWPVAWKNLNIAVLELFPIVAYIAVRGSQWRNKSICFFTDNEAIVSVINKQTSKDVIILSLVRKLVLLCLRFNINFKSAHVRSGHNVLADLLSRSQVKAFLDMATWADRTPTLVPGKFAPEAYEIRYL